MQYVSIEYTERLAEAGLVPSAGGVGDSYSNALAETIYARKSTLRAWLDDREGHALIEETALSQAELEAADHQSHHPAGWQWTAPQRRTPAEVKVGASLHELVTVAVFASWAGAGLVFRVRIGVTVEVIVGGTVEVSGSELGIIPRLLISLTFLEGIIPRRVRSGFRR